LHPSDCGYVEIYVRTDGIAVLKDARGEVLDLEALDCDEDELDAAKQAWQFAVRLFSPRKVEPRKPFQYWRAVFVSGCAIVAILWTWGCS
jgi:hypothetical protein